MRQAFSLFVAFVLGFAVFAAPACYKCKDPQCSNVPPVDPVPVDWQGGDWPDAGEVIVTDADDSVAAMTSPCGRSCSNWKRLGCPEAKPTATGVSCYRVCLHRATLIRIPSKCWTEASTVSALRACGGIRCEQGL